jgi:hypothetical protein
MCGLLCEKEIRRGVFGEKAEASAISLYNRLFIYLFIFYNKNQSSNSLILIDVSNYRT